MCIAGAKSRLPRQSLPELANGADVETTLKETLPLSLSLSVCLSVGRSVHPLVRPSVGLSICFCLPASLPGWLSACLSLSLSLFLRARLTIARLCIVLFLCFHISCFGLASSACMSGLFIWIPLLTSSVPWVFSCPFVNFCSSFLQLL